jgi:sugar phosphate isomerase/epimerase
MPTSQLRSAEEGDQTEAFRFALNTATIRGHNLSIAEEVEIAARAGYDAIEPWLDRLQQHVERGKSVKDLAKRIRDRGLAVEGCIAFTHWIVDDDTQRQHALEETRRAMDLLRELGANRIAAPPAGATEHADLSLFKAAERYHALLRLGDQIGVTPVVELWGFSKTLRRLGEVAFVAIESGHPKACVLLDVFHLYKGGSGFTAIKQLSAASLPIIHMNDYPAQPPRTEIKDSSRVYPGDGVAPLKQMMRDLRSVDFRGVLSVELFNPTYYKQDPLEVAHTALHKMKQLVRESRTENKTGN